MPLPAASAPAAPLTVLLLAWDEDAPAVRAVLEAVQAPAAPLSSALVVVPAAPPARPAPEPAALARLPAPAIIEPLPPLPPAGLVASELAPPGRRPASSQTAVAPSVAPLPSPLPAAPAAPTRPPTLEWATVRVLRLSSYSLPALATQAGQPLPAPVWTGPAALPAAPYLGASGAPGNTLMSNELNSIPQTVTTSASLRLTDSLAATAAVVHPPVAPPVAATLRPGPDSLAPLVVPGHLAVPPFFAAPAEEPDAPLDPDFPATSSLVPDQEAPLADYSAPSAWDEALAALQHPLPAEAPPAASPEPPAPVELPAPLPPTYPVLAPAELRLAAPDLNFQIIQYARFAVPVALAEQPFRVLYAPSWPTWLAAQELRQRTNVPLVLHLTALAADAEPADTATGWPAELQRQALRRADLVLVETHALGSRLRRELGLPAHAVRVVPAADTAAVARALRRVRVREAG